MKKRKSKTGRSMRPKARETPSARLETARGKLSAWLPPGVSVPKCKLVIDPALPPGALALHTWPNEIRLRDVSVGESVLLHELVHAVQNTQETTMIHKLLYRVLAEGLADGVAKTLYPDHPVKYKKAHAVVALLLKAVPCAVTDLLRINDLVVSMGDYDQMLQDSRVHPYARKIMLDNDPMTRSSLSMVHEFMAEGRGWDVTIVSLGEEWAAWKFYLDPRFDPVRRESDAALSVLYEDWEKAMSEAKIVSGPKA